jgi:hypothetical protein
MNLGLSVVASEELFNVFVIAGLLYGRYCNPLNLVAQNPVGARANDLKQRLSLIAGYVAMNLKGVHLKLNREGLECTVALLVEISDIHVILLNGFGLS